MTVQLEAKGLRLPLASGEGYFNYFWLRDNDPSSIDPVTRERVFDISELHADPVPEAALLDGSLPDGQHLDAYARDIGRANAVWFDAARNLRWRGDFHGLQTGRTH